MVENHCLYNGGNWKEGEVCERKRVRKSHDLEKHSQEAWRSRPINPFIHSLFIS